MEKGGIAEMTRMTTNSMTPESTMSTCGIGQGMEKGCMMITRSMEAGTNKGANMNQMMGGDMASSEPCQQGEAFRTSLRD